MGCLGALTPLDMWWRAAYNVVNREQSASGYIEKCSTYAEDAMPVSRAGRSPETFYASDTGLLAYPHLDSAPASGEGERST